MQTNDQKFFHGNNGKAVLLIHGITSGAVQMVPMAKFLNDYGYSVWCVNLAGHGTFPQELLHTSCEDFIAKAENILIPYMSAVFLREDVCPFTLLQIIPKYRV